jgi:hypothetical protein
MGSNKKIPINDNRHPATNMAGKNNGGQDAKIDSGKW